MGSSFVHLIRTDSMCFFLWLGSIPLYIYVPQLLYPQLSVDGHLGCFHVLAIVNRASVNIGLHVSFSVLVSTGYMPRSGIAGSYGGFIPSFLRRKMSSFFTPD